MKNDIFHFLNIKKKGQRAVKNEINFYKFPLHIQVKGWKKSFLNGKETLIFSFSFPSLFHFPFNRKINNDLKKPKS